MNLLFFSVAASAVGAVLSLLACRNGRASKLCACLTGAVAALLAIAAGCVGIFGDVGLSAFGTPLAFASFSLMLNPLSGLMLVLINVLALAAWVYGLSYFDEYLGKGIGRIGFFMNVFIASMCLVVTVDNAFWFLVFFELMSLSSYFLVVVDGTEEARRGGLMYLIVAHVGFLLIAVSFFVMASAAGSLEFQSFRTVDFAPGIASAAFLLAFVGFGCKAGIVPLHSWLPQAHPAAPSNVSALMSGGMIKIGVFGMLKVAFDLIGPASCQAWWGVVVLLVGAVTAVLGVAYALGENDVKKLLAYSSVENIGVILLGLGTCMVATACDMPAVAALGMVATLFHMVNHAAFKGLLFMGAGSVLHVTGTRDMRKLGGLGRLMPVTSAVFLVGALAISAIPPLNGFASEWIAYQAMFGAAFAGGALVRACAAFGVICLALTGALAAVCFVKAYGVTFLGAPRSVETRGAGDSPLPMKASMAALAVLCVLLGVGAPWVVPVLEGVASSVGVCAPTALASGAFVTAPLSAGGVSLPLVALALIVAVAAAAVLRRVKATGGTAADRDPWACGYLPTSDMAPASTSFAAQADMFMHPLYQMRTAVLGGASGFSRALSSSSPEAGRAAGEKDPAGRDPFIALVSWLGASAGKVEGGNFRVYILYILVAFLVLAALLLLSQMGGGVR